jgi:hypothetical protein
MHGGQPSMPPRMVSTERQAGHSHILGSQTHRFSPSAAEPCVASLPPCDTACQRLLSTARGLGQLLRTAPPAPHGACVRLAAATASSAHCCMLDFLRAAGVVNPTPNCQSPKLTWAAAPSTPTCPLRTLDNMHVCRMLLEAEPCRVLLEAESHRGLQQLCNSRQKACSHQYCIHRDSS